MPTRSMADALARIDHGFRVALRARTLLVGVVAAGSVWLGLAMAWQLLIATRLTLTPTPALALPVVLIVAPVWWAVGSLLARRFVVPEASEREEESTERSRSIRPETRVHVGRSRRSADIPLFEEAPAGGRLSGFVPLPDELGVGDLPVPTPRTGGEIAQDRFTGMTT